MVTNQEILQRLLEVLKLRTGGRAFTCPILGHNAWRLDDAWAAVPSGATPNNIDLGKIFPMAVLLCTNCGNTHFLNLITMGFTPEDLKSMAFSAHG